LTPPAKSLECALLDGATTQHATDETLFNNQASKRVGPVRDDVFTDNQF